MWTVSTKGLLFVIFIWILLLSLINSVNRLKHYYIIRPICNSFWRVILHVRLTYKQNLKTSLKRNDLMKRNFNFKNFKCYIKGDPILTFSDYVPSRDVGD